MMLISWHSQGAFMKKFITFIALIFSLSAVAASGVSAITMVLEQNEVEKLEQELSSKGFTLSKVVDVYATRGVAPRCPCTSLELTFTKVSSGKSIDKKYGVYAQGFGTSLIVSVQPIK
jgi:hypothetical protein